MHMQSLTSHITWRERSHLSCFAGAQLSSALGVPADCWGQHNCHASCDFYAEVAALQVQAALQTRVAAAEARAEAAEARAEAAEARVGGAAEAQTTQRSERQRGASAPRGGAAGGGSGAAAPQAEPRAASRAAEKDWKTDSEKNSERNGPRLVADAVAGERASVA